MNESTGYIYKHYFRSNFIFYKYIFKNQNQNHTSLLGTYKFLSQCIYKHINYYLCIYPIIIIKCNYLFLLYLLWIWYPHLLDFIIFPIISFVNWFDNFSGWSTKLSWKYWNSCNLFWGGLCFSIHLIAIFLHRTVFKLQSPYMGF